MNYKRLATILSSVALGACASIAPTDPRSGNHSMSCGPEDNPVIAKNLSLLASQFKESLKASNDDGGSITTWRPQNGDLRFVVVSRKADGQTCISGNYRFEQFIPAPQ